MGLNKSVRNFGQGRAVQSVLQCLCGKGPVYIIIQQVALQNDYYVDPYLYNGFYYIPSSEILEFPSVINFDIITTDDINFHFYFLP